MEIDVYAKNPKYLHRTSHHGDIGFRSLKGFRKEVRPWICGSKPY